MHIYQKSDYVCRGFVRKTKTNDQTNKNWPELFNNSEIYNWYIFCADKWNGIFRRFEKHSLKSTAIEIKMKSRLDQNASYILQ